MRNPKYRVPEAKHEPNRFGSIRFGSVRFDSYTSDMGAVHGTIRKEGLYTNSLHATCHLIPSEHHSLGECEGEGGSWILCGSEDGIFDATVSDFGLLYQKINIGYITSEKNNIGYIIVENSNIGFPLLCFCINGPLVRDLGVIRYAF